MNENLMVNSKTDILEFKRKHNLLVANGTIKANVSNIKTLSNDVINNLRCGDIVLKEDASGKHAYLVSFKSDTGLCLTYCDASCVETQSYDKVEGNWVYNSQDLFEFKPLFFHPIAIGRTTLYYFTMIIINNDETPFTKQTFLTYLKNTNGRFLINGAYYSAGVYLSPAYVQVIPSGDDKDKLALIGIDSVGTSHRSTVDAIVFDNLVNDASTFEDAVNRIN